ncbi:MAG: hypothetical protein MSG64_01550 [Pyrinomonadaceae bacterium MAG19_C2-C3]|nr:hypothetical protein [Pyrinomonadaceae bacterium MAG19_C2-C3]
MWKDKIVEDIHRIREEYAASFNHDLNLIYEDIKQKEREGGREVISAPVHLKPDTDTTDEGEERKRRVS